MATIVTGTEERNDRHSTAVAPLGLMASMGVPVAVIVGGVAAEGWGSISWAGAVVWGVVATVVFTGVSMIPPSGEGRRTIPARPRRTSAR